MSTLRHSDAVTPERAVIVAYSLLYVAALGMVLSSQHARFWESPAAAIVLVLFAGLLVALLCRRGWAWGILMVVEAAGLIVVVSSKPSLIWITWNGGRLLLLVSPPMRRYIKKGTT